MIYIALPIFTSFFSVVVMSYVAMAGEISSWGSSVIAVLLMLFLSHFFSKIFSNEYVVGGIAAGALGGMIGVCVGSTWPSLYFLHKQNFLEWMQHPLIFAGSISLLVLIAGTYSFFIAAFLRDYVISERKFNFPLSQLMHDMIDIRNRKQRIIHTVYGIVSLISFRIVTSIGFLHMHMSNFMHVPIYVAIGFISGATIIVPMVIGIGIRLICLYVIKNIAFVYMIQHEFLLTLAIGMLLGMIAWIVIWFIQQIYMGKHLFVMTEFKNLIKKLSRYKLYSIGFILFLGLLSFILHMTCISIVQQFYLLGSLLLISNVVTILFAKLGKSSIKTYVNFILLPYSYFFVATSSILLYIATFGIVCLGIMIDLFFSHKLGDLSRVSYKKILRYQYIGFFTGVVAIGFVMWVYIHLFKLGSTYLPAQAALSEEVLLTYSHYNYYLLAIGFVIGLVLLYCKHNLLVIVGAFMMSLTESIWFVLAGVISVYVKKDEYYYTYCFGIYSGHTLFIIGRALFGL